MLIRDEACAPWEKIRSTQRKYWKQDWKRELPNIVDKARRRHARMFGDRFNEQVGSVSDIGERAKERRAQRNRNKFAGRFRK